MASYEPHRALLYCTLLETWLLRGHPEIIGEEAHRRFVAPQMFEQWAFFFLQIPDEGVQISGNKDLEGSIRHLTGWYNLGLLDLFDLVDVQPAPPQPGEGWLVARVTRTSWGDALLALLYAQF